MIERKYYDRILQETIDQNDMYMITGMYRSGKTAILKRVQKILRENGVSFEQILYIDFEAAKHSEIRDGGSLVFVVRNLMRSQRKVYLLLDEIDNLPGWEKALVTIYEQYGCKIYLTGTQQELLASGLTEMQEAGFRLREISAYPYCFNEYVEAAKEWKDASTEFYLQDYMLFGNNPGIHRIEHDKEYIFTYLLDIMQAGLLQDVVRPWKIRNVDQVFQVLKIISENMGRPLSAKVISDLLKQEKETVGKDTVYTILKALLQAHLIQKVSRYDEKKKKVLEAQEKYYFSDWGMYHSFYGLHAGKTKPMMENIACMELLSHGWQVYRIDAPDGEIDFMAVRGEETRLIQVIERTTEEYLRQQAKILGKRSDAAEKMIIVLEEEEDVIYSGIRKISFQHFLIEADEE